MQTNINVAFTHRLVWSVPVDDKHGSLSVQANGIEHSLRCSVLPTKQKETEVFSKASGQDQGFYPVKDFMLLCWTRSASSLSKDQECDLTHYGQVRIKSKQQVGDYGRYTEIMAEKIE